MPLTTRRSLLVSLAGAALLTGCSNGGDDGGGAEGAPAVSREKRLKAKAARESADLLGQYDQALGALPSLAARLTPLRDEVERHVKAFGGAPRPSASTAPSTPPVAEKDVLKALAAAERELSDRRMTALAAPDAPAELARLLASVAAAGAGHAFLLSEG
ncbi:hypothetical protein [Streptomyces sp. VRA16 Mangrove soil]|uniref:hypothetical protein n=1 Tax=Streptomyces sp. VRA16 Mangrove soil TaxID=2817434 RepID=UPI001A9F5097|nr:hypothetical protein [Streptomyces sp. VRA16 Mangrove soil]MBO1336012.1 hypothetical protein [Streptomyces sp. VRA16 Mangrove soil]